MRRTHALVALVVALTAIGGAVLVRRLSAGRTPGHDLNGAGELHGSLDTWPTVARAPGGRTGN